MTVGAVLKSKETSTIVAVEPSATILEIAEVISSRRIGAVLVLDAAGGVAGIVSERDVVKALAAQKEKALTLRADSLMTRNVTTATSATTVVQAMNIMDAGYFRHLPVVNNGKLEGIISIRDLVRYRIQLHEQDLENMKAYIARMV
ncbi:MAG: CBS domain-containing protein [Acetobacteraceae bacterium]|nr:CBS domain-containing protein [Pseudomonadota bacterium]